MRQYYREDSVKRSYVCSSLFRSDQNRIHVLFYLGQPEELGLTICGDISVGMF